MACRSRRTPSTGSSTTTSRRLAYALTTSVPCGTSSVGSRGSWWSRTPTASFDSVATAPRSSPQRWLRLSASGHAMPTRKTRRVALDLRGLSGREELFRLSGAVKRDPAVQSWFSQGAIELRAIAQAWFAQIRECGADARELMHDGCPVACVEDAAFAYVNTFKSHVSVGFFCGALLADPATLLEGSGKRMRHVKLTLDREPNVAALRDLILAAYVDVKTRLDAERAANND